VIEGRCKSALLEVAADDRDGVDGGRRWDAHGAKRGDQSAPRGVAERQVVDRGGEDVRDLLRDQLLGRGHADEQRLVECADRAARLLAQGGVRLVAEDEVVGVAVELRAVAGEPGVRLDRDRIFARRAVAAQDGFDEAVAVPLGRQIAVELGDEQAAVSEDEDAEPACGLDEAGGRDRLPGRRRVPEPVATDCTGVRAVEGRLELLLVDEAGVEVVLGLLLELGLRDRSVAAAVSGELPVAVLFRRTLRRGDELREHARESVDLVTAELGTRGGAGRVLGEHALEAEHEPVAHLPARGRLLASGIHLRDRVVERCAAGGARSERVGRILVRRHERLAEPGLGTAGRCGQVLRCVRRPRRGSRRFVHTRST
jgi:hypothetical protein